MVNSHQQSNGGIGLMNTYLRVQLTALTFIFTLGPTGSVFAGGPADLIYLDGFDPCLVGTDYDFDRLDDCEERALGTDSFRDDTDGDFIDDGDEALGTLDGLDLPAMGADPLVQNILLEYDWFDDDLDVAQHSHRPSQAMMDRVADTFAAAPTTNADGTTGIVVIQDFGQGGEFTGGNFIDDDNGVLVGGVSSAEFLNYKSANFASNRKGYFHYVILPHRYNTDSGSSGQAELNGDDIIVSVYEFFANVTVVSNTIVHELGHNLGLLHGGDEGCNYKPNYNSVMNYRYQFPGVDDNCTVAGDGVLDYSSGLYITLDENDLDENAGICGNVAIDWDGDANIENGVVFDTNPDGNGTCGGTFTTLRDHDDWGNVVFTGLASFDRGAVELIDCQAVPTSNIP